MPGGTTEVGGNTKLQTILGFGSAAGSGLLISSPASLAANTSVISTYTIPGLLPFDFIDVQQQGHFAGLSLGSAFCATPNILSLQWINSTTGTITTQTFTTLIQVTRFENANVAPPGIGSPWLQAIV